MLSHRKGVLLDGIGSEFVRSSAGGRRKTLSAWLGGAGDMTVTATGSSTARSLADWFQGYARGSEAPDSLGHFTDKGDGVLIHRFRDRIFLGDMNDDDGSTTGGGTWIEDEGLGNWIPRSAQFGSHSTIGGIGVHGAARVSDRYKVNGTPVSPWVTSTVYAASAYAARQGKIYQTAAGGTSGGTPPTHTTGDASDGGVTWTFVDYAYGAPVGLQGTAIYDTASDGQGAWAGHLLAVRKSGAGTIYGLEIDALNRGADVTNNPYSITPSGATVGLWLAAGYDLLASANPATCAILIGQADSTWNTGIVFESDGITSGGYAIKYAAVAAHAQGWFNSSGEVVSTLYSDATANNERSAVKFGNRHVQFLAVNGLMGAFESAASAGTAADEYVRLIAYAAGNTYAEVRAGGTASNLDLLLSGKGTGVPKAVTFYATTSIQLGNASDTTLTRSAAGILAVEGVDVLLVSGAQTVSATKTWSARQDFTNASTGLTITSATPRLRIVDSDAGSDQTTWDWVSGGTTLLWRTRTDADGAGATYMTVTRSGTAVSSVTFGAGLIIPGGTLITTNTALTNGAAAQTATMTNGPTAGNPTKWVPINDNGTTRYCPLW